MCARTMCLLVSSTRNIALGSASVTTPSISMTPSFLAIPSANCCCHSPSGLHRRSLRTILIACFACLPTAPGPQKGTTGQTTNSQHYGITGRMLNPAMLAHSVPVCTKPPRRSLDLGRRGDPVQDGQPDDVGCRALQGNQAQLPRGVGATVQREGTGGEHEHGVAVGQRVAWIQCPGEAGV